MIRPNFLYIGVARAGSTWLFNVLREHPEIYVPPAKDIYFFDRHYDKGMTWYLEHFREGKGATAIGELSHDYYLSAEAADRIHTDLPGVRLICCLREPVDCLRSGYLYNRTMDLAPSVSLEDFARAPQTRRQFDYFAHLKRYLDLFGRERLLIVFYEDLAADPAAYVESIYRFLGVDTAFQPPSLTERINPARDARNTYLARAAYRVALALRKMGLANLVGRIKESPLTNQLLYRTRAQTPRPLEALPDDVVAELRKNHRRLETLIGRPLPDSWYG